MVLALVLSTLGCICCGCGPSGMMGGPGGGYDSGDGGKISGEANGNLPTCDNPA
jgi:hypothetical protein